MRRDDRINQARTDQRLADPGTAERAGSPTWPVGEQIVDRGGQVLIGVHQPAIRGDDSVAVGIGVVAHRNVEARTRFDQSGHGVLGRTVHADLAVPVQVHKRPRGVDRGVDDGQIEVVGVGNRRPHVDSRTAQRISADPQTSRLDGLHVDNIVKRTDISADVVEVLRVLQVERSLELGARNVLPLGKEFVGTVLNPRGFLRTGRTAVWRVVLDAAVSRRVVAGGQDDAVGLPVGAGGFTVVAQHREAQHGSGRVAVTFVDERGNVRRRQNFVDREESRFGKRVRVAGQEQRAGDALSLPVFHDRLSDGRDVSLVERTRRAGAPVARGAERHPLGRIVRVGDDVVVVIQQLRDVGEVAFRSGKSSAVIHTAECAEVIGSVPPWGR